MFIQENVPLQAFSTMRLGGNAAFLTELSEHNELAEMVTWAKERNLPIIMIGDGSNIVWKDEGFEGLIIINRLMKFEIQEIDQNNIYVSIGAGENWDNVVERCVKLELNGIAELSLIPGTSGATPVQNVGAYGREISEVLVTIEAYDVENGKFTTIPASECEFSYRSSRFKVKDHGKFLITAITLLLNRESPRSPFYESLNNYFLQNKITDPTVADVRDAVIKIRSTKLPDPDVIANNGSFFANPYVDQQTLSSLIDSYPDIKYWHTKDNKIKLSAAWLLESAGFFDNHDQETGMATWPSQTLVLVNEHARSTADLLAYKQKIIDAVAEKFDITLTQEPELLPL